MSNIKKRLGPKLAILKISDILTLAYLPAAAIYACWLRYKKRDIWLVCERKDEARDNGFAFFKYCMEGQKKVACYYAIDKTAKDYEKVKPYAGNVIPFGSFRHWAYYLACQANISSQKNNGPNTLCGFLFRKLNLMNNKIFFLQHGTIINDCPFMHYRSTKFRLFCCGAWPEYLYVKSQYGYPEGHVAYVGGQCRHDLLHGGTPNGGRFVLVMPTWRDWLFPKDPRMLEFEGTDKFEESNYFRHWAEVINHERLTEIAECNHITFIFYPHPGMQRYVHLFQRACRSSRVIIADKGSYQLPELVKGARALVTDYSSIFFDFIYMKKPVVFYQFDEDTYRAHQYPEGYFSYKENPFSKWGNDINSLLGHIQDMVEEGFSVGSQYEKAHREYFPIYDANNSKRTFEEIYKRVRRKRGSQ